MPLNKSRLMSSRVAFLVLLMMGNKDDAEAELDKLIEYIKENLRFWALEKVSVIPEN